MKVTAICIGSVFDREKYLMAVRLTESRIRKGEHVLLLPLGMAKRAIKAEKNTDFLYFLSAEYISECITVSGDSMDAVFIEALRERMEELQIPFSVIRPEEIPAATENMKKKADEWQFKAVLLNERIAGDIFGFMERFLAADHVEQVSEAIAGMIPKESFMCIRDSFLQDLYSDQMTPPRSSEKYFILCDSRKESRCWESYTLEEMFPDAEQLLEATPVTTLIPIHCKQAYVGYMVHISRHVDEYSGVMELCSVILDMLTARYITERKLTFANHELLNANENVARLQETDVLTGLRNSMGFMKDAEDMLKRCKAAGQRITTVCVDLDRLGNINEIYGHLEGDIAIQMLAQIIADSVGKDVLSARMGSDEFIVLFPENEEGNAAEQLVELLRARLQTYNRVSGKEYTLEANISSLTITPDKKMVVEDLLDEAFAKKRMLKESRSGRRSMAHQDGIGINEKERGVVRGIMDENAFLYAFQPIISARTGEIVAYEALMRTQQAPKLSPLTILKYATMDERLYDIELSTFNNVLRQVEQFKNVLGDKKLFINSIPGHFLTDTDYKKFRRRYKDFLPNLVVEITEETEFETHTAEILRARSDQDHFEVAIDDFGSGYSNMSNLLKFLPNYVKIDRTLIENVHEDPKKQHFVKTIIEFAHDNGFQALAEGVETSRELSAVVRMGVDLIQGYYTAKPSFILAETIAAPVRDEIVRANVASVHELSKKIYLVNREKELFLIQLAMEHYTGIILSQSELVLHGNPDLTAGISIKIKDGCSCRLRISNVRLGDLDNQPCIDIGKGASLTLIVEGINEFEGNGIHVPEDASLRLEGSGSLKICPILSDAYCIGADSASAFGRIECAMSGALELSAEGNHCIAIGGGRCQSGDGIRLTAGRYDLALSGDECVGIGCFNGEVPISITDVALDAEARVGEGAVIGALHGRQNIEIRNAAIKIVGSGSSVTGIGTSYETGGSIRIDDASIRMKFNGRKLYMIGGESGKLYISVSTSDIELLAEGNMALGIGTLKQDSELRLIRSRLGVVMRVGDPTVIGVKKDMLLLVEVAQHMSVNDEDADLYELV